MVVDWQGTLSFGMTPESTLFGRAQGDRVGHSRPRSQCLPVSSRLERNAQKEHYSRMYMSGPAQRIVCVPIEQRVAEAPQQEREPEPPPPEPVREPAATAAPSSR